MSEAEFDIMDECYFVISYEEIRKSLPLSKKELEDGIRSLLKHSYLQQLKFDNDLGDFVKMNRPELNDLSSFSYLATKEGLLAHNT